MKKKMILISMILCTSLIFGACSQTRPGNKNPNLSNTTNEKEDPIQSKLDVVRPVAYSSVTGLSLEPGACISIIGRYSDDSYWKEVESGAKQAINDLNSMLKYKGNDKIRLSFTAPEIRDDVNEQVNLLDEELDKAPTAICIAPTDTSACSIQFDLAAENGIPIITFDSGSDYKHIVSHLSTNNLDAAATAASKLAYAIQEEGEVAVFVQDSVSMTAEQRLQGFKDTIAKDFPNVSIVNVYAMDQLDTMRQIIAAERIAAQPDAEIQIDLESITQEDVVSYILEKHPDLKGIFATNLDTTQLVAEVLSKQERNDLKLVGFDGGEEQMKLLEDGIVEGLILQNPFGMGYATVIAAARVSMGIGNESFVNCGYTWVTKDNMDSSKVKGMLY